MAERLQKIKDTRSRLMSKIPTVVVTTLVSSLVATLGVGIIRELGGLQSAEIGAYDQLMRRRPPAPMDDRVVVVGVDETFIQTRQEYPIFDSTVNDLLLQLDSYEPRVIGLDIGRDIPQGDGRDALEATIAGNERIITACKMSEGDNPGVPPAPGTPPERTAFADFPRDLDGAVRRTILISIPGELTISPPVSHLCNQADPSNQLTSFALSTALIYLDGEGMTEEVTASGNIRLGQAELKPLGQKAGGYQQTGATDYQILLNYRAETEAVRVVQLSDLLNGNFEPDWFRDRLVLIGYTSPIAKDESATPFSGTGRDVPFMQGVVIHAQVASQLISAALGDRALLWYWPRWGEWLWIFGWALVGGLVAYSNSRVWVFVALEGAAILALYGICSIVFFQASGWLPWVPSAIALLASGVLVVLLDRADESGYTQAVYEQVRDQVKGLVQPKIEIDQEQRARKVAEITESSYFKDLAARAKAIREERRKATEGDAQPTPDPED